jgi:hypothetical protein
VPQLAAPLSLQVPLGSAPFTTTGAQVPADVGIAHDMHVPAHAVWQQTPCAQIPVKHSVPSLHDPPGDLSPQEPLSQVDGATQSASDAQVALQTEVPHLYGAQEVAAGVTHAPAPSQADAPVDVVPLAGQVAAAHGVPCGYFWHAPASHMPFVPHEGAPWATQVPDGSGAPVCTFVHCPIDVESAHERQVPPQAVAQHTPCAQNVEAHSPPTEQKAPTGFFPHEPCASHVLGATQSPLPRQDWKQRAALQAKGAHGSDDGATHWPAPSHVDAPV